MDIKSSTSKDGLPRFISTVNYLMEYYSGMTLATSGSTDGVEPAVQRWSRQRPDLDAAPMAVFELLSRASRQVNHRLARVLTEYDLQSWEFDVLATLRTDGAPYEMCPGTIGGHLGVSNSTMTNRINRLVQSELVERHFSPHNRRIIIVRLTEKGIELVDRAMSSYISEGKKALESLTTNETDQLCSLLRKIGSTPHEESN